MFTNLASIKTAGILAALVVAVSVCLAAPAVRAVEVGDEAPDFTLQTHDGKELTLSRLEGKRGVVLMFFTTRCPACMATVPRMKRFVRETRGGNVLVYGVNLGESEEVVKRFARDYGVNYRVLLDSEGAAQHAYGVRRLPGIFGIDAAGVIQHKGHRLPRNTYTFVKKLTAPLAGGQKEQVKEPPKPSHPPKAGVEERDRTEDGVSFISRETLQTWMEEEKDLLVIDVLSPESYAQAHLPGAVNIPGAQLKDKAKYLAKHRTVVAYCASFTCRASTAAVRTLTELGFPDVHDYEGGLKDWKDAGLPVRAVIEQGVKRVNRETLSLWASTREPMMGLDMRRPEDYREGHIPGAQCVSVARLEMIADRLPTDRKIVVYGETGRGDHSVYAAEELAELGIENVYSLVGGFREWKEAQMPIASKK